MIDVAEKTFSFGDFELNRAKRLLLKSGKPLTLNSKTFDLLTTLVENRGQIVSKNDLLNTVWEGQFVEENNLTVQISTLRKLLGEKKDDHHFIATVPGKGYSFVADTTYSGPPAEIIVENHEYSRIIVEDIEISETVNGLHETFLTTKSGISRSLKVFVSFSLFAIVGLGFGGLALWRSQPAATPFERTEVLQLTTNGKVSIAALSPDGKLFAYVVNDGGKRDLWIGFVDGGNHQQLRPPFEDSRYFELAFSPDSSQLYYSYKDEKTPEPALYRIRVGGGVPEKVGEKVGGFSLSPDGKHIAFDGNDGDRQQMIVSDLDGANKKEIATFEKREAFIAGSLSWSPDGRRLAFSKLTDPQSFANKPAIIEIATGNIRVFQTDMIRDAVRTVWLADGSGILVNGVKKDAFASVLPYHIFHIDINDGSTRAITSDLSSYTSSLGLSQSSDAVLTIEHRQMNNIWVAPANDISAAKQITFGPFGKYDGLWSMDFTPDGRIIYASSDSRSQFISEMSVDGSGSIPLTSPGILDNALNASNDGKYVVFHSNRNATGLNIWRMDADGRNPTQLTFSGMDLQPFVSTDNRWVYFRSFDTYTGALRRVPIDGGEVEPLNEKGTSWLSFSPDGKYFAAGYTTDKTRLGIFSAETNEVVRQFDIPETATVSIGTRWTPDSRAVAFRDWNSGIWLQPINGGEPEKMTGLPDEKLYNFAWSKDGQHFAFVRGQEIRDVVLIKNGK